ncbi:MAG: MerR family transcriptional regulator [Bacteroidota bacterium]|nr:MerR family transcriptional regulator [Bacteroidota bacterium]
MLFTIKDVENLSGIKAHTIRIWEKRYSFLKPKRSDTNIRHYSSEELRVILNIALLNKYGYKISHIDQMTEELMLDSVLSITDPEAKANVTVNELLQCMIDFDAEKFEIILNKSIATKGIEETITKIILAFLDKVGILWLTKHINPVHERLVSNIIRQKLISGIDSLPTKKVSPTSVCLFLPQGEFHEISLLFVSYLLKKKGITVIYLGANIPLEELKTVASLKNPSYLYTHLTTAGQNFSFDKFLSILHKDFRNVPIIISGRLAANYVKKIPPKIIFKRSLPEVFEFISEL